MNRAVSTALLVLACVAALSLAQIPCQDSLQIYSQCVARQIQVRRARSFALLCVSHARRRKNIAFLSLKLRVVSFLVHFLRDGRNHLPPFVSAARSITPCTHPQLRSHFSLFLQSRNCVPGVWCDACTPQFTEYANCTCVTSISKVYPECVPQVRKKAAKSPSFSFILCV